MKRTKRKLNNQLFTGFCYLITALSILVLVLLMYDIFQAGFGRLNTNFLTAFQSRNPEIAGIKSAIWGTLWLMVFTILFSVPLGILSAIYLEEYAPRNKFFSWVQINIGNLAGMPSIVYGMLGLAVFVRFFAFDSSILSGSLTLALLILPVIVIASQESLKAVPLSLREAAFAIGARKWQVVFQQVLPAAIPGIMTGVILAVSRAVGESAPLIMVGALSFIAFVPTSPMDQFTVLPVQIYNWASRPQAEFQELSAAAIIVLLVILFALNFVAILIRERYQRYKL
jgi:phosphate transport system permease protein